MSARIEPVSSRRVVERPRDRASATSAALASATGANAESSIRRDAKPSKNVDTASSLTDPISPNARVAASTAWPAATRSAEGM